VVAFPTETFYGLAAGRARSRVVKRIFELKGSPSRSRCSSLVDSVTMAETVGT